VINHYFRNNDDVQFPWHVVHQLSYHLRPPQFGPQPRGVTFIQSNYIGDGVHGNFEAVVRVAPAIATTPDHLDFWFLDSRTSVWNGPFALVADGKPMDGVTGDPVLIQGNWGNQGNFELLVPRGNVIDHFFRNNDDPQLPWSLVHRLSYPTNLTPKSVTLFKVISWATGSTATSRQLLAWDRRTQMTQTF
jgi:hypothetical protein